MRTWRLIILLLAVIVMIVMVLVHRYSPIARVKRYLVHNAWNYDGKVVTGTIIHISATDWGFIIDDEYHDHFILDGLPAQYRHDGLRIHATIAILDVIRPDEWGVAASLSKIELVK